MRAPLLRAQGLVKRYRQVTALDGLELEVRPGEVLALLGPNGAGKSTTLRLLLGLMAPDAGSVRWNLGGPSEGPPPRSKVGYLPEERGLFREAPVLRTVAFFGVLRGMPPRQAERAAAAWLERLGLADRAHEKPDALSKGNQQRVQIAAALVHDPELAVLDEPFSGLDPIHQELVIDLFEELRARGTGVVLAAHQLQLVERAADRLLVLQAGRPRFSGTLADARARAARGGSRLELELAREPRDKPLSGCPGVRAVEPTGPTRLAVQIEPGAALGPILSAIGSELEVAGVASSPPSLHELYLELVGSPAAPTGGEEAV
jgi:ABC-2 type transport system ATP-binding protein